MISTAEETRRNIAVGNGKKSPGDALPTRRMTELWPPLVVFGVSLTVYTMTCAPSITWRNGGADGGDLATAVALGGVPHPTGYPLYVMLGQIARVLPFGELGGRLALFSALETAIGCAFVCATLRIFLGIVWERSPKCDSVAVATALCLAFTPTVWQQATIVEVYGLNFLFTGVVFWLFARIALTFSHASSRVGGGEGWVLGAIALVSGLAIGHHRTAVFNVVAVLVGIGVAEVARARSEHGFVADTLRMWRRSVLAGVIFVVALTVPQLWLLRANPAHAPANWGGDDLWWQISGALYRPFLFATPMSEMLTRANQAVGWLLLSLLVINLLALAGIIELWRERTRPIAAFVTVVLLLHSFFALSYDVNDASAYTIPALMAWLVAAGVGAALLLRLLLPRALSGVRRGRRRSFLPLLLLLAPALMLVTNYGGSDLHADSAARTYASVGLEALPPHAIILAAGDEEPFALWYGQHALGTRRDVAIIHVNMLSYDWYCAGLRRSYPTLIVPPQATNATILRANADRPAFVTDTVFMPFGYSVDYAVDTVERTGHHLYALHREP